MNITQYFSELDNGLAFSYAVHLRPLISKLVTERCHGCRIDHPSQIQHDVCVMMDEEEKIRYCMSEAILQADEKKIINLFRRYTGTTNTPSYVFEINCQNSLWSDAKWRNLVVEKIVYLNSSAD